MEGKTHKAIGVATGVAMVACAMRTGDTALALGMATAPFGAMLPDIDHDRSKLGAQRKVATRIIKNIVVVQLVLTVLIAVAYDFLIAKCGPNLCKLLVYNVPVSVIMLVANSNKMREKYKFLHKHRGIMHTLLVPVLICFAALKVENEIVDGLLYGLALGYMSHLLADSCTVSGTPITWPISEECVRIGGVVTGGIQEKIVGAILCIGIVVFGILNPGLEQMSVLYVALGCYSIAYVLPNRIEDILYKSKKSYGKRWMHSFIIPLVLTIALYILKNNLLVSYGLVGAILGFVMTDIDYVQRVMQKKNRR